MASTTVVVVPLVKASVVGKIANPLF